MIRIYADFNSQDENGRIRLNTVGSLRDLETYKDIIHASMKVVLYMPGRRSGGSSCIRPNLVRYSRLCSTHYLQMTSNKYGDAV